MRSLDKRLSDLEREIDAQAAPPADESGLDWLIDAMWRHGGDVSHEWFRLLDAFKIGGQDPFWRLDEPQVMKAYLAAVLVEDAVEKRNSARFIFLFTVLTNYAGPLGDDSYYFPTYEFLGIRDRYEHGDDPPMRALAIAWREEKIRALVEYTTSQGRGDIYQRQFDLPGIKLRSRHGVFGMSKIEATSGKLWYQRGDVVNVPADRAQVMLDSHGWEAA